MNGLFKKSKKLKVVLFTLFFVLFSILSPTQLNHSQAAGLTKVIQVTSNHISNLTQWVTEEQLKNISPIDWSITGIEKMVDSSSIVNGVWQAPAEDGFVLSLAKTLAGYIIKSILAVVYLVLWVAYSILYGLVLLSEKILEIVLDPTFSSKDGFLGGFTTKDFVRSSAQLLANLCNMMYLLFLIYIAIKAMFGSSNTRSLLIKLVFAALLTNFGLVLAGVVIDFAQVIMYTVWEGIKGSSQSFAPGTKILDQLQTSLGAGRAFNEVDSFFGEALKFIVMPITYVLTEIIKIAGLIVMSLALVVTLISITVILMVRIFMLWIILILTPVAFLFSILPQTEKYWNMWLENLSKYAFTGPILVFFLWLALKLSATLNRGAGDRSGISSLAGTASSQSGDLKYIFYNFVANNISILFEMGVVVVTIWGGIIIANSFGIKGALGIEKLIGWTNYIGLGSLAAAGRAFKGIKMAGWRGLKQSVSKLDKEERGYRAEAAKFKEKGDNAKFQEMKAKADEIKKAREGREKLMKSYLAFAGFTSPTSIKSAVSKWWKDSNEEYFNYSEESMKHHFNRFLDNTLGRKDADIAIEGENAEKNLYDITNQINSKADQLREKEVEIQNQEEDLNNATAQNEPANVIEEKRTKLAFLNKEKTTLEEDIRQQIVTFTNRVTEDENEKNRIKTYLENLVFNLPLTKTRITSTDPTVDADALNNDIDAILNIIKSKQTIPEYEKIQIFDIFEDKIIKALQQNDGPLLNRIFVDFEDTVDMMEQDVDLSPAEASLIKQKVADLNSRMVISGGRGYLGTNSYLSSQTTNEVPFSQFVLKERLIESTGNIVNKNLIQQTREIAVKNKREELKTPIWSIKENDKKIEEADKLQEKQRLALEQLSDMIVSGNKTLVDQTAALRKLSGSAKHFGDLIKKLSGSYGGIDGAKKFLSDRFGERESLIAFRTAELDARKNHNLYGIGHAAYDPLTNKSHFTTPDQRKSIIRKAVSSWDSRELNQIHVQSFDNKEDVEMLAKTINWQFLSKNRPFIKGMRDSVASLLNKNSDTILSFITDSTTQEAFKNVRDRVDPEPKEQQSQQQSGQQPPLPRGGVPRNP